MPIYSWTNILKVYNSNLDIWIFVTHKQDLVRDQLFQEDDRKFLAIFLDLPFTRKFLQLCLYFKVLKNALCSKRKYLAIILMNFWHLWCIIWIWLYVPASTCVSKVDKKKFCVSQQFYNFLLKLHEATNSYIHCTRRFASFDFEGSDAKDCKLSILCIKHHKKSFGPFLKLNKFSPSWFSPI